ncbi:hypothetical protein [Coleofasciculus sp. B1-GNL1-01]|uniref:hypothetical protein n=1 Tax=Coleofasciculus sp. B1-GNL1-01 TaxID=3068484 RepID=UPI0040630989
MNLGYYTVRKECDRALETANQSFSFIFADGDYSKNTVCLNQKCPRHLLIIIYTLL